MVCNSNVITPVHKPSINSHQKVIFLYLFPKMKQIHLTSTLPFDFKTRKETCAISFDQVTYAVEGKIKLKPRKFCINKLDQYKVNLPLTSTNGITFCHWPRHSKDKIMIVKRRIIFFRM